MEMFSTSMCLNYSVLKMNGRITIAITLVILAGFIHATYFFGSSIVCLFRLVMIVMKPCIQITLRPCMILNNLARYEPFFEGQLFMDNKYHVLLEVVTTNYSEDLHESVPLPLSRHSKISQAQPARQGWMSRNKIQVEMSRLTPRGRQEMSEHLLDLFVFKQ